LKIDGGCHCCFLAYGADADPDRTGKCHCTGCRTLAGSAFRTIAPAKAGTLKLRRRAEGFTMRRAFAINDATHDGVMRSLGAFQ